MMHVVCRYGHFALYPSSKQEVQRFMRVFKLAIFPQDDYYTFEALLDLPRWSQQALVFGNLPAVVTYEAQTPWEIMRQNEFVFSLATELLVPLLAVTQSVSFSQTIDCAVAARPLLQPGGLLPAVGFTPGSRLLSYTGDLDLEYQRLYLSSWEAAV